MVAKKVIIIIFLKVMEMSGGELHKNINVLRATELHSYKWFMYILSQTKKRKILDRFGKKLSPTGLVFHHPCFQQRFTEEELCSKPNSRPRFFRLSAAAFGVRSFSVVPPCAL